MSDYFGVLGNRDHIKMRGEKWPYWRFLDRQPDGWLSSLVYLNDRVLFPESEHRRMLDCGAWSYKHEDVPKIGKRLLTPDTAWERYQPFARSGDWVIAPDHILLGGAADADRAVFNRQSAERFLEVVPSEMRPMACIHGDTIDSRVAHATQLASMGYRALAIGGVAARASQKALVLQIVAAVRRAVPDVWLHVLGLSSPAYAVAWHGLGIQSYDGSSHFKQAFTGGAFYTCDEHGKLHKHAAAKQATDPVTAPACDCRACDLLRGEGVDTRRYGSNEHNMGRAAHNQNMLMRAHEIVLRRAEWGLS